MTKRRQKRHHQVSRFYLQGFADATGQTMRLPLDGGKPHRTSISDATVHSDYYTVEVNGERSDFFEGEFAKIEGLAAGPLRELIEKGRVPTAGDDRMSVAAWIALQYLRSDVLRQMASDTEAQGIRLVVGLSGKQHLREHIETHEGRQISAERLDAEWADLTKPSGPILRPDATQHIATVLRLHEPVSRMLYDAPWHLLRFERRSLLTGDHPVGLIPDDSLPEWEQGGIINAWAFGLTLSRHCGLFVITSLLDEVTEQSRAMGLTQPGTTAYAALLNDMIVANARRAIYYHPDDDGPRLAGELPEANRTVIAPLNIDEMIRPEGAGQMLPAPTPFDLDKQAEGRGFSLRDVEWPIPNRVLPDSLRALAAASDG